MRLLVCRRMPPLLVRLDMFHVVKQRSCIALTGLFVHHSFSCRTIVAISMCIIFLAGILKGTRNYLEALDINGEVMVFELCLKK